MANKGAKGSPNRSPAFYDVLGRATITGWRTDLGLFLIGSSAVSQDWEELHFLSYISKKQKFSEISKPLLKIIAALPRLDPLLARSAFKAQEQPLFTSHLLFIHSRAQVQSESVREDIAWRYKALTYWGEPSVAKVFAEEFGIPIRTAHARLRQAREKGDLGSPGSGSRLGRIE